MIGHFPAPYPDELLYSICARFSTRAGYPNAKSVIEELLGATTAAAVVDLPNRLGYLAATLPANSSFTVDRIIDQHTLLPFFTAFQPASRVKQLRDDLEGSHGPAGHMRSGVMASRIPTPNHLRFCPVCKQADVESFGETYWHRLHQLPGIEVCPSHQTFLENSSVDLRAGRKFLQFISAEQATRAIPVRHIDLENQDHRVLLQVVRDAEWLLDHPSAGTSLKAIHIRYIGLLIERGLATHTRSLHVKKLLNEFSSCCSPALLKLLHCELIGNDLERSNWLLRLVRDSKYSLHPLYHLLLIQFLGRTVEEFFQLPEELDFFGEGPWPCLNSAADHYKQQVITECRLGKRLRNNKPVGIFSCECGFSYARTGPAISMEDRLRVGKMISFGPVWETKLKKLWRDSTLSMSEIGRQLAVDPLTVRKHAARLRLPFSRSGKKTKQLNPSVQLKGNGSLADWKKRRNTCRSKWLSAMKHTRKITMKALRTKRPREYAWLLQNDSQWLKRHNPHPKKRIKSTSCVDWKRRDAEYVVAVRSAASHIKNTLDRPVQLTKTAIGRIIGAVTLLQQKLHKMPMTAQALARVVETREQYAVRRVWWAAGIYCEEDVLPRKWQLVMRANVHSLREVLSVEYAVEGAMIMLTRKLSRSGAVRAAS